MSVNVVWKPLPGSQSLAISCPADEILFEGTRGPGKTAAQLARFRRLVGLGYGSFWRGVIFDTEYKNLADIITQSKRMFRLFNDGSRFLSSSSELRWVWPTGEELLFRFGSKEDDYWDYHGQEFPFIGFNELTKQPSGKFYEAMFSCRRTSFRPEDHKRHDGSMLPPIPLETFSTTNPFGVGHSWVKRRFIDPIPRGRILRQKQTVYNPQTKADEEIELKRVAIHGSYRENKYLDPVYVATLMAITDPNKRKAWLEGSWDVTSGGRFDHLWDRDTHVIKPFKIPRSWRVDRSHDWGESKPFSNLWWAESDGTPVVVDGKPRKYPAGSLFLIGEWYGCPKGELNTGLNMPSADVAKVVTWIDKRIAGQELPEPANASKGQMNITPGIAHDVQPGPADSAIYNTGDNEQSIATKMATNGCRWVEADKRPGSRINGASLFCDMLEESIKGRKTESGMPEQPAFYVFDNCTGWISRVPILSRDSKKPDDVDTAAEDHDWDATRYRVLARGARGFNIPVAFAL